MKSAYSDEMINAFVDDELDKEERLAFKQLIEQDQGLYHRVRNICEIKKAVKASYSDIPVPEDRPVRQSGRNVSWAQVAVVAMVMCLGLVIGWFSHKDLTTYVAAAPVNDQLRGVRLSQVNFTQPNKIILHVSGTSHNRLKRTLDKIQLIISQYSKHHAPFQLEIIANAGGLDLLRDDVSPYKKQIEDIMANYRNVSFFACSNALDRLRSEGIKPVLIKHTKTGATAVEQIVKRLQEGWVYVKV